MGEIKGPEIAVRMFPMLTALASKNAKITYGQIRDALDWGSNQGMREPLNRIKEWCAKRDLPPLHLVVVNSDTGLPGDGALLGDTETVQVKIASVYAHDWGRIPGPIESEMCSSTEKKSCP